MNELNNNFFQQYLKQTTFKTPDQQTRTASQSSSTSATQPGSQQQTGAQQQQSVSLNLPQSSPQATPSGTASNSNDAARNSQNLAGQVCREVFQARETNSSSAMAIWSAKSIFTVTIINQSNQLYIVNYSNYTMGCWLSSICRRCCWFLWALSAMVSLNSGKSIVSAT